MTTFSDIFKSNFLTNVNSVSVPNMILALFFSFILGLFIFGIYKKNCTSVMYSSSFGLTLVGLSLVTTLVILAVTSNVVLSLGMVGALSIVRFRTAIKEPMEIVYLFWAIAVGIVIGAGFYPLATIGSAVVGTAVVLLANKKSYEMPYILVITLANSECEKTVISYINHQTKRNIVKTKSIDASHVKLTCEVQLNDASTEFVNSLLTINGVVSVSLVSLNEEYLV